MEGPASVLSFVTRLLLACVRGTAAIFAPRPVLGGMVRGICFVGERCARIWPEGSMDMRGGLYESGNGSMSLGA